MSEDKQERLNRELIELLNELRVALPGVQVLFAFLLVVPFQQGFTQVTELQKNVYFFCFICTALASVLLIAPSAYHRIRWRQHDKEQMLMTSNRLTIAGTACRALGMTGTVFLITDLLFASTAAAFVAGAIALAFAWFWYGLPLMRRLRDAAQS
jgi:hypothetical protein